MEKDDYLSSGKGEEKTVCDKEEKIGQLLAELLESERSYVQDLNQVISSLSSLSSININEIRYFLVFVNFVKKDISIIERQNFKSYED